MPTAKLNKKMKILLLTNKDIASCVAANQLISALPQHQWRICTSERVGKPGNKPEALNQLAFVEQALFFRILFPALKNQVHHPTQLLSFSEFASQGIEVSSVANINDPACAETLSEWQPDLWVSVRFGQILKAPVLSIPKHGVLNLHSGILPDYRGVMATFWAMLRDETHIGTSLHWIPDDTIDTGDILSIETRELDYSRSYLSNMLALYDDGVASMQRAIECIDLGTIPDSRPHVGTGDYFTYPNENALSAFHAKGLRLYQEEDVVSLAHRFMPQN